MDRATDRAGEAGPAVGAHPVQAALLEIADRRLDGGMLLARLGEVRLFLDGTASSGPAALDGHGVELQQVAEGGLVVGAVKAAIEAAGEKLGEALLCGGDERQRGIRVASIPQDPMLGNEPVLIVNDCDGHAQFHRDRRLAVAVPPRVLHEDREHLLLVRDGLSLQDPPVRLLDLALRVPDIPIQLLEFLRPGAPFRQCGARGFRLRKQLLALAQERGGSPWRTWTWTPRYSR